MTPEAATPVTADLMIMARPIPYLIILNTERLPVPQPPQLRWMQRNDVPFDPLVDPDERAPSESP